MRSKQAKNRTMLRQRSKRWNIQRQRTKLRSTCLQTKTPMLFSSRHYPSFRLELSYAYPGRRTASSINTCARYSFIIAMCGPTCHCKFLHAVREHDLFYRYIGMAGPMARRPRFDQRVVKLTVISVCGLPLVDIPHDEEKCEMIICVNNRQR